MLCPNCKKEIENDSTFCEHCGARVKKSKKGLLITLSVVFLAIITMFIVNAYQINQSGLAHQEAEGKAKLIRKGYIGLGLPSGTLWKNANEGGDYTRYTYDEAVSRFGNKLPTKQQFEELKNICTWTWTGSGYKVIGPNGKSIYLPAAGYRDCDGDVGSFGMGGHYWSSSTPYYSDLAWYLGFGSSAVFMNNANRCSGQSVRLVQ